MVEVMVAMVIAMIVMGGVYQTLRDDTVTQQKGEQMLEMQNNARVVLDRLVRDVRRAGFLGCGGTNSAPAELANYSMADSTKIGKYTVHTTPLGLTWDGSKSILSTIVDGSIAVDYLGEALGFANDAPDTQTLYATGTDALTLVYLSDERNATMAAAAPVGSAPVVVSANPYLQNDILYITDTEYYALFQKTDTDGTTSIKHVAGGGAVGKNNVTGNLGMQYGLNSPAKVFKLNTSTYFIHVNDKGNFNLCLNTYSNPIAANIEDLQFEFLFDDSCGVGVACAGGDGQLADESWVTTLGAHTSKDVRAVRIWVLAMSEPDYSYTDNNTYDYPHSPYKDNSPGELDFATPKDDAHRHRFLTSAVVYLRNAGLK